MDIQKLIEKVRAATEAAVKPTRYEHSVRTAETAGQMCRLYGIDEFRGYLAGIGHDMCKDLDSAEQLKLAARDGREITTLECEKPSLLHGRAAAVRMQEDFNITDAEVLQAVACHTFGGEHLCPLAKIIYAADKIEPGREYVTPEYQARLFAMPLDMLVYTIVQENVAYLEKNGRAVAPVTYRFLEALKADAARSGGTK